MELAETYRIAMRIAEEIKPEVDAVVSKMVDLMEKEVPHFERDGNGFMATTEWLALGACVMRLWGIEYAFTLASLFRSPTDEDKNEASIQNIER